MDETARNSELFLVDGSGFIFRAYHALPPLTRKSDGLPIGAVAGFSNMLWKYIEEARGADAPTHAAVIFDHSSKTFRNEIYSDYKANRPEPPDELKPQFPLTREATRAFNVACIEIADFEAEYPEIDVQVNTFDHEGYKTAIRNFMTADAPDLANWYAGNRMGPFVEAGQFMDVSDIWAENNLTETLGSALSSMTIDGKQWGIPYTYYQWGIYTNKDVYAQVGVEPAATWDEFIANCEKFKAASIDCLTTGSKALWPVAGLFDYLSLRTNGYDWHMQLTNGEIPWTDDSVRAVFAEFAKVLPYVSANHAAIDWQDAVSNLVQGKAANYVMGNFAVATFKDGGMTDENLGFMP